MELLDQSRYIAEKEKIVKLKDVDFSNNVWTCFKGHDLHCVGDVECAYDWSKKFKDIMEIKEYIIKKGYSGVTLGTLDDGNAYFKKVDHVITKEELTIKENYEIWVYDPSKEEKPADPTEEEKTAQPDQGDSSEMDYDSEQDEEEFKEKPKVPYFHLTACKNGGVAELDANFARKVYLTAKKKCLKKPDKGYLEFYRCYGEEKLSEGGGMYFKPGDSYLVPVRNMPTKPQPKPQTPQQ